MEYNQSKLDFKPQSLPSNLFHNFYVSYKSITLSIFLGAQPSLCAVANTNSLNSHPHTLTNSSTHALFLSIQAHREMKLGRAAIVSLVELTIDFLLSIINAVLTTKQGACTHNCRPVIYLREDFALWEVLYNTFTGRCKS